MLAATEGAATAVATAATATAGLVAATAPRRAAADQGCRGVGGGAGIDLVLPFRFSAAAAAD